MRRFTTDRYMTNPDDLAANRSGTLTDQQRRKALMLNWGTGLFTIVMVVVVGGLMAFPFFLAWQEEGEVWALAIPALIFVGVGGPVALITVVNLVRLMLTRQDVAAGDVQQADGVVVWRRSRYAAEFPGRAFWTNNSVTSLAPGPYRFYYLPRSGYVLSAEKLGGLSLASGMSGGGEVAGLTDVLGRVIGFGASDLEANRDGRLGGGQMGRMVTAIIGLGVLAVLILVFAGFMAFGVVDDMGTDAVLPLLFIGAIGLIGPVLIAWSALKLGLDLLGGRVERLEGMVQRTYASSGRSTSYYYQVAGQKFSVSLRAYQALVSGPTYRVYYAPRSKRLVALEAVGQ